ncbi:NAD(P)-dependent oxidoreductase [Chitinophaga sp. Mgbs1]|uniref:NAD(P)-dependent oxidoreductase n=1 Tax=Chitinophaga solisilvae TaxID=1233460 RepID=A0A3S1CY95_9BACT|nr:NAD(P)-dependent oxidoreductase [Chitinophaga solisilvae]
MTTNTTNKVTVIGLGDMGAVLAGTLLQHGYEVTVWNRSPEKAAPLQSAGAHAPASLTAAITASPIVIVCVTNYNISSSLLQTPEVTAALKGRVLVELTSGIPQEARTAEQWATSNGIGYIDGAILATPSQMGRPDTPLFVSGAAAAWQQSEPALRTLAGGIAYMGEDAGAAATWDIGFLITMFGAMSGFFHGAKVFAAEGIPISALGNMIHQVAPVIGEMIKRQGDTIESGDYSNPESSLDICANGMDLFIQHARQSNISTDVPVFIKSILKRAQDAGFGKEQVAATFKTL